MSKKYCSCLLVHPCIIEFGDQPLRIVNDAGHDIDLIVVRMIGGSFTRHSGGAVGLDNKEFCLQGLAAIVC